MNGSGKVNKLPSRGTLAAILILALVAIALALAAVILPGNAPSPQGLLPTQAPLSDPSGSGAYPAEIAYPLPPIVNTTGIILLGVLILVIALGTTYRELRGCLRREGANCPDDKSLI